MTNLKKAKEILEHLKTYDKKALSRVSGLSETFQTLLEDHVPDGILEDIKYLDSLSPEKKKAFIEYLYKAVDEILKKKQIKKQPSAEKKETFKKTLPKSYFKNLSIKELKLLKPIEKRAFKKVGIENVEQALFFPPKKYEDKRLKKLAKVSDGEYGLFEVEVVEIKKINRGKLKTLVVLKQGNHFLNAFFVHDKPFLFSFFRKGKKVLIYGKVNVYGKEKSIIQPEIFTGFDKTIHDRILPVYSLRGDKEVKTTSQTINHLRRGIHKILEKYVSYYSEYLPEEIRTRYKLPDIHTALKNFHFPPYKENIDLLNDFETRYQLRLIFDELFILELAQSYRKKKLQQNPAPEIKTPEDFIPNFEKELPFFLTNAQKRAIKDILEDISKPVPMNRMVQGDVGSGKTMVAIAASYAVALNKKQTAVMAPTEILAQQHYKNFKNILEKKGVNVVLLTGSLSAKEKREVYRQIESGEADVVVGTHALIQDELKFKNLALVIVDEQHRFGVVQRKALIEKSHKVPHVLVMTATPIPRTLTLAIFGDLDVSIIDELPAGRKPVKTILLFDDEREGMYKKIRQELEKGRQVFVVYPLIEESEKIDLKSAEEGFKQWQEAFPDKKVVLLHGKMSQEEKDRIMNDFKEKKADILVSTTVIEVGVDVPNASVMVIEEAHRFGLSQIHQLRGRVGRGQYEGFCFLVVPAKLKKKQEDNEAEKRRIQTIERLKILVRTNNGFEIAEEDLKIRGSGDIIGTAQSGRFNLQIADLERPKDRVILEYAKKEADELIEKDPELKNYPLLKEMIFDKYAHKLDLVNIA
ncbi:MAG: ATP-dependent DNA helicase RecG [Aquificae bacterium]|nr:ATP-dependent DNA helicase RecG [Aquificota bacterium]